MSFNKKWFKWLFIIPLLVVVFLITLFPGQNGSRPIGALFTFNNENVDKGFLYTYTFTSQDGQNARDFYLYIKDVDELEVLDVFYPETPTYAEQYLTFDMNYFMHEKFYARQGFLIEKSRLDPNIRIQTEYTGIFDVAKKTFKANEVFYNPQTRKNEVEIFTDNYTLTPHYDYFALTKDLGYAFRFVNDNVKEFRISLSAFSYPIQCDVRFTGLETQVGVESRKYEIRGQGLLAYLTGEGKADIWLSADSPRYMVKFSGYSKYFDEYRDGYIISLKERVKSSDTLWQVFKAEKIQMYKDIVIEEKIF